MPITRTADTDDDGTGTTGTVRNNAWKTAVYAAIDDADAKTVTLVDGATVTLLVTTGTMFRLAAAGDRTMSVPTGTILNGQRIIIQHFASGGARTLSLTAGTGGFRFGTTFASLSATSSGKTDYIEAAYNSTDNKWDVINVAKGF